MVKDPVVWTKFIRIEFKTHYGNQYYCPITSVQVFGTSMIEEAKVYQEHSDPAEPLVAKDPTQQSIAIDRNIPALKLVLDMHHMCPIFRPDFLDGNNSTDSKPAQKENSIFGKILKRLGALEQSQTVMSQEFKNLKADMYGFKDAHDSAMTSIEQQVQKSIVNLVESVEKDLRKSLLELDNKKATVEARLLDVAVVVDSLQSQVFVFNLSFLGLSFGISFCL